MPIVFVCSATPPADNSIEQCTLNDSVIKHAHYVTADIKGPEPSQEEETALAPPVHCFYVGRPLQFIIQYHPKVFAGLNSLYLPSINADWLAWSFRSPEVHQQLFGFSRVQEQTVLFGPAIEGQNTLQ